MAGCRDLYSCPGKLGRSLSTTCGFRSLFRFSPSLCSTASSAPGVEERSDLRRRKGGGKWKPLAEMSVVCSIPPVKIRTWADRRRPYAVAVRDSNAEGPLRRPVALPPTAPPTPPSPPVVKPAAAPPQSPPKPVEPAASVDARDGVVTLEYQRKMAKEMQEYFRQKKLEEADQGPFFGFLGKNEIANGRWAMFGFAVGLLTEYATGADFVQQLKILLSNFGIVDLD